MADWVRFIDLSPDINATGQMEFLRGQKERLVIIGRGLENKNRLLQERYEGTKIWTYDILIEQAISRLNNEYASQARILGLDPISPFK